MAKPELGTKRVCPETGKKFYDLGKNPIVSPFTGTSYPLSYFETTVSKSKIAAARPQPAEAETEDEEAEVSPEFVPLEEAEEGVEDADVPDLEEAEIEDPVADDDTFLEEEEDEGDDVVGIIGPGGEPEEER